MQHHDTAPDADILVAHVPGKRTPRAALAIATRGCPTRACAHVAVLCDALGLKEREGGEIMPSEQRGNGI
jgi:hypothetical protein